MQMDVTNNQGGGVYDTDDARWQALQERSPDADGRFVYAVATTGVYCRPTCPSRLALRCNVTFYETGAAAETAGFRPCKRCRPEGASLQARQAEAVTRACRIIEAAETPPKLDELAAAVGLSPYHFHRLFTAITGVTPKQYAFSLRAGRVQAGLRSGGAITTAIYDAGFSSSGRFYDQAPDMLGMTPGDFQRGGRGVTIRYTITASPLGLVLVAGTDRGICAVRFGDDRSALEQELRASFPEASITPAGGDFDRWVNAVLVHLDHPDQAFDLPLDIRGTAFQQRVWQALRTIPAGQTASYTAIAARIGQPAAVRAVARACASNPVAVIVPCHRVVKADGALSGYRWGVARKRALLAQEGAL